MSHGGSIEIHSAHGTQKKLIIFSIFFAVLAFLIVTSFYDGSSLTGSFISGINHNSTIKFYAELTPPVLDIKGNFEKIEIRGSSDSFFYVGNQKFKLNARNNYVALKNYTGEIKFDSKSISELAGKAVEVNVNGIIIEPSDKDSLKVSFESDFEYTFLNVEKEALVDRISYSSSGIVKINSGKNIFNLNDETIGIENFVGSLKVENNKFKMNGSVESMEIQGENVISVSQ